MNLLTGKEPIRQAVSLLKNGGGIFSKALLHSSFLIACLLLFLSLPACAQSRTITITSALYATHCDSVALDFRQSPVRACGLRLENGHLLTTPMLITPARVGLLLMADQPGTYEIPILPQTSDLQPLEAPGNELVGVLEDTRVPWISEEDSARNFILTVDGWCRANGAILIGGKAYLHTDGSGTEDIDAAFDQLLDQELESFQLKESPSFFHLPSYIYFLLGVGIYFLCWFLWRRRNKS